MSNTDQFTPPEERESASTSQSPWLWVVGIVAAIAIIALIVGDTSSRDRYLVARQVRERDMTQQESGAVNDAVAAVEQAADEARDRLADEAAEVRSDLDDLGEQLREAAEARGDEAAAHLDAAIAWLDETISDIDDAAENAGGRAAAEALDDLNGRLADVQEQLVRASSNLPRRG